MATTTHVSRRPISTAALAGTALAAAPLTFAQASEPDPVFAAIAAYQAAYDAHIVAFAPSMPPSRALTTRGRKQH